MDQQHTFTFEMLPFDIHFELCKQLEYPDILRLAATNRHFHQHLHPKAILGATETINFVLDRDAHLRKIGHEFFACSNCFRFLPKKKFVRACSFYDISWSARFCLDCTATLQTQRHLKPVASAGCKLIYYFCHNCGDYRTKSAKCQGKRICSDLEEDEVVEALSLCAKPRRKPQGFEILPKHILAKISSFLGLLDVIHLAQASRELNDIVKPNQWVPLHNRYRFVHDTWINRVRDVEFDRIKEFPCYICCKIHPKTKFTPKQLEMSKDEPETAWKMRCQPCVWLMGRSDKSITRIEHRRREICGTCGCIKYARKTCGGCLELFAQGAVGPVITKSEDSNYQQYLSSIGSLFGGN
ncbi:hypothetical protein F53441_8999 [Fusarium austroafricanum]|uniref:F-box domain-containing protein n=1 Tax=Fusarium austroafricanum TaxID=2364996 RepID=A0A8H4KC41_9HYPO|nr:hypothetical protein F53441_8999 [Fusarium austroafricanum]